MDERNDVNILEVDNLLMTLPFVYKKDMIIQMGPATNREWMDFIICKFLVVHINLTAENITSGFANIPNDINTLIPSFEEYISVFYGIDKEHGKEEMVFMNNLSEYFSSVAIHNILNPSSEQTVLIRDQRLRYVQLVQFLNDSRVVE